MSTTLRLVGSIHHGGLLHRRLEQAGLTVVRHDRARGEYEVDGDANVLQHVVAHWDGEGRVEVVAAEGGDPACWAHHGSENGY